MRLTADVPDAPRVEVQIHFYENKDDTLCVMHVGDCQIFDGGNYVRRAPQGGRRRFPPCQKIGSILGTARCSVEDYARRKELGSNEAGMKAAFASALTQYDFEHEVRKQLWLDLFKRFPA